MGHNFPFCLTESNGNGRIYISDLSSIQAISSVSPTVRKMKILPYRMDPVFVGVLVKVLNATGKCQLGQ